MVVSAVQHSSSDGLLLNPTLDPRSHCDRTLLYESLMEFRERLV